MNIELETLNVLRSILTEYRETGAVQPAPQEWWPEVAKDLWAELSDASAMRKNLGEVYDHFTAGRISKPLTYPKEVFDIAEELETERVDREVAESLADVHASLDACGIARQIHDVTTGEAHVFDLTERIEIIGLQAAMCYGIKDARTLAVSISKILVPTPGNMRPDEKKRDDIVFNILPIIDRTWHSIIATARKEGEANAQRH